LLKNKRIKRTPQIENLLKTRPVRSLSGIVNVSVLTKSWPCPGKCLYCPKERGLPKSYLSGEPAVERAKKLHFDPYLQVLRRLETLKNEGHPTDKIELRIVGATWSCYPKKYQDWFIKRCFDAANEKNSKNQNLAQKQNEKARQRIIGLSVETRPDFINPEEIKRLRDLGVTLVELGIQSIYDDVLKKNVRGHLRKEIISATRLLKDAGFKVLYQIMPNLYGSSIKKDLKMAEELFSNPDFRPDLLKIYPCAPLKEAPLYKLWKNKKYRPYTEKQLINLLKETKKKVPYYVRIQRIARDISQKKILEGPAKILNIRQILTTLAKKEGWRCKCIRCREVKEDYNSKEKLYLFRQDYPASDGKEIFLSFENKNRAKLYSLLRLRVTQSKDTALIREVHTYGPLLSLSSRGRISNGASQHRGLGKKLIKEAEKIIYTEFKRSGKKESGVKKIAVIAAIGAREYFRRLGYKLENTYMVKNI